MKRVSKETKENIINQFNNGVSVTSLTETTGIPRSTIYGWLKSAQIDTSKKPVNKKRIRDLESSVTRLSTIVEILQRVFEVESIPTCFRLEEIEKIYGEYNVHNICEALKVPRATFTITSNETKERLHGMLFGERSFVSRFKKSILTISKYSDPRK